MSLGGKLALDGAHDARDRVQTVEDAGGPVAGSDRRFQNAASYGTPIRAWRLSGGFEPQAVQRYQRAPGS